jgi:hypothetical protein
MEVLIDWHVIAESLWHRQNRIQLNVLDWFGFGYTLLRSLDGFQHVIEINTNKASRNVRFTFDEFEAIPIIDDLKVVPELSDEVIKVAAAIRKRQNADDLWEVGI